MKQAKNKLKTSGTKKVRSSLKDTEARLEAHQSNQRQCKHKTDTVTDTALNKRLTACADINVFEIEIDRQIDKRKEKTKFQSFYPEILIHCRTEILKVEASGRYHLNRVI